MSTDWEGSKGMINRGEIGVMVLGSWAVAQFQQAGDNPQDIGYMPFPITVINAEGKRVTSAGGNYCYAINKKTGIEQQIASMLYVKWLLDASPIFEDEGCIPARKDAELPAFLASFDGIALLANNPAPAGHEDDFDAVNLESEVGISNDNYPDANIVEHAMLKDKEFSAIMDEWNAKWTKAQAAVLHGAHRGKRRRAVVILTFLFAPMLLLFVFTYLPFFDMIRFSFYDRNYLICGIAVGFVFKFFYSSAGVLDSILMLFGMAAEDIPMWLQDTKINNIALADELIDYIKKHDAASPTDRELGKR